MKGLLIKDIRLMKNQGRILFILLALMIAITFAMGGSSYMPGTYVIFVLSILGINTISYDEYDNSLAYLLVLPATKRQYVHEKYLFTVGMLVISTVIGLLLGTALWAMGNGEGSIREIVITCGACTAAATFFLSVSLPLKLKFEGEKGRMILPMVFGLGGVLIIVIARGVGKLPAGVMKSLAVLVDRLGEGGIIAAAGAAVILVFAISWMISLKVIEKREF